MGFSSENDVLTVTAFLNTGGQRVESRCGFQMSTMRWLSLFPCAMGETSVCIIFYLLSRYMRPVGPWQRLRHCRSGGGGFFTYPFFHDRSLTEPGPRLSFPPFETVCCGQIEFFTKN